MFSELLSHSTMFLKIRIKHYLLSTLLCCNTCW